ncbi:MAG TPA: PVC-type heme-binding CxxCH protein, partial [Humisphaera sp.]
MSRRFKLLSAALLSLGVAASARAAVTLVAPTDHQTPEQERAQFQLPPGFEAQLVAAEPDIAKPMNIAFDAKGRLWVTDTVEYPWPVKEGEKARDSVKVLSDFDAGGRARKVTTFATGLNIPLGVLPHADGAIVYSIPAVRMYRDTDGDGKADKVETLFGGFGNVDTHGMTNNFTRGFDGWVYANHGFRNESKVTGPDGATIAMQSGNTYRFRPDGTGLQLFARGQVNPFGLCFDPLGNLYSADCHTRPQMMLLRGAVYPSFGKPDDGLGFGPEMCLHDHGSTGIAGTVYYDADQFPAEYRGNIFNGNPVTNIVNRDTIQWTGSSPKAVEQKDFLVSADPWFRPVQVKLGPDGALYVADFYNKIIGHYEVDLKHPGRDRTSGRIWRIVYKGTGAAPREPSGSAAGPSGAQATTDTPRATPALPDLTRLTSEQLVSKLGDPNITVRLLATNLLADRKSPDDLKALRHGLVPASQGPRLVHIAWALERLNALTDEDLAYLWGQGTAERVHLMRILSERTDWNAEARKHALAGLTDADATVRRCAADALARHPHADHVRPLLAAHAAAPAGDACLLHAIRIAVRDQIVGSDALAKLGSDPLSPADRQALLESALGAQTPAAGAFAAKAVAETDLPKDLAAKALKHAVKLAAD